MMDTQLTDIMIQGVALFDKAHLFYQKSSIGEANLLPPLSLDDRIQALVDAVLIVEQSTIDDFDLSIMSVANIFSEWEATDKCKEDYNNCYASEMFIDLVSVLVKAEWLSIYVAQFLKKV